MKFIIAIIGIFYSFLFIQTINTSTAFDPKNYNTDKSVAKKAALFCLKKFNFKNKTDLTVRNIIFAINQTKRLHSRVFLKFDAIWPNDNDHTFLFQGIYIPPKNDGKKERCKVAEVDITLPSTTTPTTTTTRKRKPHRSEFWWFWYWLNRLG
uniref:Cystatin domain-containing protein n=1 Tax=Strongyloides stercoralis TaxID=6248 RepID=A0A0K0EFY2_STRER